MRAYKFILNMSSGYTLWLRPNRNWFVEIVPFLVNIVIWNVSRAIIDPLNGLLRGVMLLSSILRCMLLHFVSSFVPHQLHWIPDESHCSHLLIQMGWVTVIFIKVVFVMVYLGRWSKILQAIRVIVRSTVKINCLLVWLDTVETWVNVWQLWVSPRNCAPSINHYLR